MKSVSRIAPAVLVLLSIACAASTPKPGTTPLIGTAADQRLFAGVWRGEVQSADGRFTGPVEFRFEPGDAVVIPSRPAPSKILWVRVTDDSISGALEPYFDGSRRGEVYTTFDATLADGTLSGTLHERVHMRWRNAATWSVQRVEK